MRTLNFLRHWGRIHEGLRKKKKKLQIYSPKFGKYFPKQLKSPSQRGCRSLGQPRMGSDLCWVKLQRLTLASEDLVSTSKFVSCLLAGTHVPTLSLGTNPATPPAFRVCSQTSLLPIGQPHRSMDEAFLSFQAWLCAISFSRNPSCSPRHHSLPFLPCLTTGDVDPPGHKASLTLQSPCCPFQSLSAVECLF